jgi:hypothetical protein
MKATRVNYSKGEPLKKLTQAVEDWLCRKGMYKLEENMTLPRFCALVSIPQKTLEPYIRSNRLKRREVGVGVGPGKTTLMPDTEDFLVDVMRRRDRGNDGMDRSESIQMMQDLQPELSHKQAERQFDRNVRPAHKDVLTGIIKAEATTSKRSAITVEQQYRWHSTVDSALKQLRKLNTGLTPDGKSFGEVMPHFVIGGDETSLLASNGEVKIIGDKKKKKHEKQTVNSRTSITLYRTGSSAGSNGPTAFLPPGMSGPAPKLGNGMSPRCPPSAFV